MDRRKSGGKEPSDEERELSSSVAEQRARLRELKGAIQALEAKANKVFVPKGPKLVSEVAGER